MKKHCTARQTANLLGLFLYLFLASSTPARAGVNWLENVHEGPSVLVVYDGPNVDGNPGRLDGLYLSNLLGHFTTRRKTVSLQDYRAGDMQSYDAVFCIVYEKQFNVPSVFINDVALLQKPFCWLSNQVGQLERAGLLSKHGLSFDRLIVNSPATSVIYKGKSLAKGDPDTNILKITDPERAQMVAEAVGPHDWRAPYIVRSGDFWVVADSPFSYSSENDRYLAFADVLHDILKIEHAEEHFAMLRLEDLNPLSDPDQLRAMLRVIRSNGIPFAFGMVPFYVNPNQHMFEQLSDQPDVVAALKEYASSGGQAVLHGDTHQYRGVTTDDFEFWDNIADRPVKRDSDLFASRRLDDALKESAFCGLYPLTWETPHYAASATDYRVFKTFFNTVFERRLTANRLGTDQFFPYPVIDIYGQYVIPESMGYVQEHDQRAAPILANAEAALVVRDGYASFFFHPFLKPALLNELLRGIQKLGYHFVGLPSFPNRVSRKGYFTTNIPGAYEMGGEGRYVTERTLGAKGNVIAEKTEEVAMHETLKRSAHLRAGETFIAFRHSIKPVSPVQKLLRLAKGDVSVFNQHLETLFSPAEYPEDRDVTLLWDEEATGEEAVDQHSFEVMLDAVGYEVNKIPVHALKDQEIGGFSMLVVPEAAARKLLPEDVEAIHKAVEAGIVLLTDGQSPLSHAFAIDVGGLVRVSHVENHLFPTQELHWPDQPLVPWIEHISEDSDTVLFSEREDRKPLVINRTVGEGRVLYLAPYFDSLSGNGYSRFPDVPYLLVNEFRVRPLVRRSGAEAYFDPGFRQNVSVEQLAKFWKKNGIRVIHVAAWHFYDKYNYDYERLVRVAHQNGILVYAWFEWPHVSEKFWNQHPEWREKNAFLADARGGWRYLMNLQNPDCYRAVVSDAKNLLRKMDWDGVNLAELHFESMTPQDKAHFTPLNSNMRKAFEGKHGFDPLELWKDGSPHSIKADPAGMAAFLSYRKEVNQELLRNILKDLRQADEVTGKKMEFVVTVFDVYGHPELSDRLGIDGDATIEALNKFDATLQVEDPAEEWSKSPLRYVALGDRYKKIPLKRPFMIDINVLGVHSPSQPGFATNVQSGTEILELWRAASKNASRVCLYSESTISESDWELLPYAMASDATVEREGEDWVIKTADTITLELTRPFRRVFMDDRPWFATANRSILVPPGEHRISLQPKIKTWFDTSQLETRLISLSGELVGAEPRRHGLEVEYRSSSRCAILFNKQPFKTYLDEKSASLPVIKGPEGYVVLAPPGQHRLRVVAESAFLYLLNFTSVVSASLIVLFGAASSGLLFLMFVLIKINRRLQRVQKKIRRHVFPTPKKAK